MANSPDSLERRIAERAFELWIEEGQPSGRAEIHWRRAREVIMGPGLVDQGESLAPGETNKSQPRPQG